MQVLTLADLFDHGSRTADGVELTESFSIERVAYSPECMTVSLLSQYSGEGMATVQLEIWVGEQKKPLYTSHVYNASGCKGYALKEWRVPPLFREDMRLVIKVTIPEGARLSVASFSVHSGEGVKASRGVGLRHNAHLGFWSMAPNNTMPAFELAARCGFSYCIAVPKVTKDGVIVCIHDDTINNTARDENGNPPEEPMAVADMTYEELLSWDFGRYKNPIYKGTRIPTLEEFFDLCMKTGMSPMFSTHPGLSVEKWCEVKKMLKERGLLSSFHIKSFGLNILARAYSIFGTEIDGYTFDCNKCDDELISELLSIGIDNTRCRLVYEHPFSYYTEETAKKITDAGLLASAYSIKVRTADDYARLVSWGVNEFTEDCHCSMGLNW